ncbi:TetR/AcrR family transcriptional regulator [Mycobacterium sp. CVI_P3]|uniref:TetR/AcrR family transcriptional regulator n=1 Tax=Mycobacterium pinniadriaticum TaxID=2994102 RepID=A0ABT3S9U6_9MYCO|nr:TetR/AcrR family transcriptional regulator [Mycobacterium pinniadriaticum]MCX2930058.1 TetR/AcrR family transcriptional regulator [Mycobacterium pinniadriaticum]MCX2936293.1 TetR/AcrR family transcriptional regulator [Mycobacterium pinniadriaticum]
MVSTVKRQPKTNRERVEESTVALLASAIELFARQGYERTTAAEIGTNAGFSRNMVRDRYGSKDALLQTVFEEFARQLLPAVRGERIGTGLDHVLGQVDDLLNAVEREPETMRAMIVLTFETPGPLQTFAGWFDRLIADYESELAAHLAAGQVDGSVRDDLDPAREAEVFVSYAIGLCFRSALRRDAYDFPGEIRSFRNRIAMQYGTARRS